MHLKQARKSLKTVNILKYKTWILKNDWQKLNVYNNRDIKLKVSSK